MADGKRGDGSDGLTLPGDVMQAWADINIVFGGGWPPSELERMSLTELARWWQIARARHEQD